MRNLIVAAILFPSFAMAQPTKTKGSDVRAHVTTQAFLPDYSAKRTGTVFYESYSEANPCTPHSHDFVLTLQVWRRSGSFPNPTAVLYRDGAQIESWTITTPTTGDTTVNIGQFRWTADHPCPGSGTASVGPNHPPNYRLVVDPANRVAEQSEKNNTQVFYMDPSKQFVRLP
jgi:hypothetical protein